MRKSSSIDPNAVLEKTREILEAEHASAAYRSHLVGTTWNEVATIFDAGMLLEAKVDQLKHEYAMLLTGKTAKKAKTRAPRKATKITTTTTAGASDA